MLTLRGNRPLPQALAQSPLLWSCWLSQPGGFQEGLGPVPPVPASGLAPSRPSGWCGWKAAPERSFTQKPRPPWRAGLGARVQGLSFSDLEPSPSIPGLGGHLKALLAQPEQQLFQPLVGSYLGPRPRVTSSNAASWSDAHKLRQVSWGWGAGDGPTWVLQGLLSGLTSNPRPLV